MSIQLRRFLGDILHDHRLFDDLSPDNMAALNGRIGWEMAKEITYFGSVAPSPSLWRNTQDSLWRRALYALVHRLSWDGADVPAGLPWLGPSPPPNLLESGANDGIVPLHSQVPPRGTFRGVAFGDHFDVVGHYSGGEHGAVTLLSSGASFNDDRFNALWSAIAGAIAR